MKANPLGGSCMSKGIVLEKMYVNLCHNFNSLGNIKIFNSNNTEVSRLNSLTQPSVKVSEFSSSRMVRKLQPSFLETVA